MAIKYLALLVMSFNVLATEKTQFNETLQSMIEKDPEFKNVDFQTLYYETQVKQGYSRLLLPKVNVSHSMNEQHNNASQVLAAAKYKVTSLNASFDLFNFGSDWNFMQSSRMEQKAQVQRVLKRLMVKEEEIGSLYFEYLKEKKNLSIIQNIVDLKEKSLKISQTRYQNGALSEQDLNKVRLDVSNARGEFLVMSQALTNLEAKLLSYLQDVTKIQEHFPWEKDLTSKFVKSLLNIPFDINELPQFQEISYTMESLEHQSKSKLAQMFGNIQLNFARTKFDFDDRDQYEWRTSLVYTLPLFDQFNQYTNYQQIRAQKLTQEVQTRFMKKRLLEQQKAEEINLKVAVSNFEERSNALVISKRLYQDSLSQFNRGQLSVNELLVDQDRLLRTEQLANMALYQAHLKVLQFCHSRGQAVLNGCF